MRSSLGSLTVAETLFALAYFDNDSCVTVEARISAVRGGMRDLVRVLFGWCPLCQRAQYPVCLRCPNLGCLPRPHLHLACHIAKIPFFALAFLSLFVSRILGALSPCLCSPLILFLFFDTLLHTLLLVELVELVRAVLHVHMGVLRTSVAPWSDGCCSLERLL